MFSAPSRKIVIIQGHPDPAGMRFCHALANSYALGAMKGGHAVRRVDIAKLEFPLLRTQHDFERGPIPESLQDAWDAIRWADHIVFVFPLWLGTMPAILKGFLEQVARPGYAFQYVEHGFTKKLLAGRSARLVVTMGMPAIAYRLWYMAHGLRGMERNILKFVGITPVHETLIGMIGDLSEARRDAWLERLSALGFSGR